MENCGSGYIPARCEAAMSDGNSSSNTPDRKPVGVPRRFAVGTVLIIMTMYSVLFAVLRSSGMPPGLFTSIAVFLTGVGAAQMLMFRGRRPRDASFVAGALLFPLILLAACFVTWLSGNPAPPLNVILLLPYQCVLGVLLGYLAGCLTAGVFLILGRIDEALHGPRAEPAVVVDGSDPGIQSRLSWDERLYNRSRKVLSAIRPYHRGRPIGDAASLLLIVLVFAGPLYRRPERLPIHLGMAVVDPPAGRLGCRVAAGNAIHWFAGFLGIGPVVDGALGGAGAIALHTLLEHVFYFTDHPLDRYIPLWLAITLGCLLGGFLLIVVAMYHHLRFRRQQPCVRPSFRVTGAAVALLAVIYASASLALLSVSKQPRQRALATIYRLRDYRSERLLWCTTPPQVVMLSAETVDDDLKHVAAINELRYSPTAELQGHRRRPKTSSRADQPHTPGPPMLTGHR